jgi:RNA polymerase sigma-70 factor (ECF subfamily)
VALRSRREFEDLALVHLDAIYRSALRLTRSPQEAEDLTQEVYLRAFRFFHQFERGTNCRAWLFKILKNAFLNRQRAQERERQQVPLEEANPPGEPGLESIAPLVRSPEENLLQKVTGEQIERAVEELPQVFRRIFILSDVEGFSYKEIAEIEDCPLGTVMSRLFRARRMLQNFLRASVKGEEGREK